MARYSTILRDQNEVPISGAVVSVINPTTDALAALTDDLGTTLQNPFTTNVLGDVTFNAADNVYRLEYRVNGIERRIDDVIVGSPSAFAGPAGPAFATYFTLANFKAASTSNAVQILQATGIATGLFYWETANAPYTADNVNVIKADSTALSVGAWVRQSAAGITDAARLSALAASGGSALAGFIQSGTGAVARTVQAKLRETISVKDFGAVGDGVTDDTAAIQGAINSLVATGGMVFFPQGRYLVTSSIAIRSKRPISLRGEMMGQVYDPSLLPAILVGAPIDFVINYQAPAGVTRSEHGAGVVSGLAFVDPTGGSGLPGTNTVTAVLRLYDFTHGLVENCTFHFIKGGAILTDYCVMSTVRGCRIRYSGDTANGTRSAIRLSGTNSTYPTQSFVLEDTRVEVCYADEYLNATPSSGEVYDITIRACKFEAATTEFPASSKKFVKLGAERFLLEGCSFNRNNAEAVEITVLGRGKIVACHFTTGPAATNSLLIGGARNVVTACSFEDTRTDKSIEVTGTFNIITGNTFYTSGVIYCSGASNSITDNLINQSSKTASGWAITVAGNSVVSGNQIDDNGVSPAIGGIVTFDNDLVYGNLFRRWTGQTAIRRESAGSVIFGNRFGTVGTAYSQSTAAAAGSGVTFNGTAVVGAQQAANADTSGATLLQLETEVNELKAALRSYGLIAP